MLLPSPPFSHHFPFDSNQAFPIGILYAVSFAVRIWYGFCTRPPAASVSSHILYGPLVWMQHCSFLIVIRFLSCNALGRLRAPGSTRRLLRQPLRTMERVLAVAFFAFVGLTWFEIGLLRYRGSTFSEGLASGSHLALSRLLAFQATFCFGPLRFDLRLFWALIFR